MFIAKQDTILEGYEIAEVDVDGVGQMVARVNVPMMQGNRVLAEKLARILVIALNMDGSLDRAIEMLRAETVRQRG